MKLKSLYALNTYSFEEFFLDFDDFIGQSTVILGKNKDQKTANGAGKTSILKVLYWNLFSKEINDEPLEFLINRNGKNGALSRLIFTDRGHTYQITRYKDYKGKDTDSIKLYGNIKINGTGVEFLVNGEPLHGESHPQTQKIIEQKIKITSKLFLSSVLMAQNSKSNFLEATDTEKKELLSELLDLQAFAKAFDSIKKDITETELKITNYETKIENHSNQKEKFKLEIEKLLVDESSFITETDKEINEKEMSSQYISSEIHDLKKIAELPMTNNKIEDSIKTIKERISFIKEELSEEPEIVKVKITDELDLVNINKIISSFPEEESSLTQAILELTKNIITIDSNEPTIKLQQIKNDIINLDIQKQGFTEKISNEISLHKKCIELENSIKNHEKEIVDTNHTLTDIVSNNLCNTCKRKFDDLSNIHSVTESLHHKIKILEDLIKDDSVKLDLIKNELITINEIKIKIIDLDLLIKNKKEEQEICTNKISSNKSIEEKNLFYKNEIKKLQTSLVKINESKIENEKNIEKIIKRLAKIQKIINDFEPLKIELNKLEIDLQKEQDSLNESLKLSEQIKNAKKNLIDKETQLSKLKIELVTLKSKTNPYTEIKKRLIQNIENLDILMSDCKKAILLNQDELKYLNFWKIGFAPTGIRSFITDDVIELLNRKTQDNLNDLFDGALSVMFDPESKSGKGVVSNKISTTYLLNGKETKFGLLSGGEQCRAILATNLALTEIAEARSGTKFNIRFLDEPFNGMDDNGQMKSLSLFTRLSRDKDGFFIISHEEKFQNLCQKALYIVKQKEISKIVSKDDFEKLNIISDFEEPIVSSDEVPMSKLEKMLMKKRKNEES